VFTEISKNLEPDLATDDRAKKPGVQVLEGGSHVKNISQPFQGTAWSTSRHRSNQS